MVPHNTRGIGFQPVLFLLWSVQHPWDRLPACPFLVVVSSGCFAVLPKADRLEAYAAF
jgi:hypothetical protein